MLPEQQKKRGSVKEEVAMVKIYKIIKKLFYVSKLKSLK